MCSWCRKMIGLVPADPLWKGHIEYCIGCDVWEIAVRIWVEHPEKKGQVLELRFHPNCVNEINKCLESI